MNKARPSKTVPKKDMTRRTLLLSFLLLFSLLYKPLNAAAQFCDTIPATITTMIEPEIGAYNLWDQVAGTFPEKDSFVAAFAKGKDLIVAGQIEYNENAQPKKLWLLQLDYRGRIKWQAHHEIAGLKAVKAIAPHPDGLAVLGTLETPGIVNQPAQTSMWFGVFDAKDGTPLSEHVIDDPSGRLHADAMLALDGQKGFVLAGHLVDAHEKTYTVMHRVNMDGRVDVRRSYRSGEENQVAQLAQQPISKLIAAVGRARGASGRTAGWAIGLDEDLKLIWESTYARGAQAAFRDIALLDEDNFVVAGWAESLATGKNAGFVMGLESAGGVPAWERFYRSEDSGRPYRARAVMVSPGPLISVALAGGAHPDLPDLDEDDPRRAAYYPYVRLLTINRRGNVILSEDHRNASAAFINDIVMGFNQNRMLLGSTLSPDALLLDTAKKAGKIIGPDSFVSLNGWAIGVPSTGVYDDPCAPVSPPQQSNAQGGQE